MSHSVENGMEGDDRGPTSPEDTNFQIYYNGKFVVSEGNVVTYDGGESHTLLCNPEAIFTNMMESLGLSLYGQKIWYKLPFEMFTDLKLLYSGSENFYRMCLASKWTKAIDIFTEKEVGNAATGGEEQNADRGVEEGNATRDGEEENVARGEEENVARGGNDRDGSDEYVDEDEACDSEGTPQNSDCEDVQIEYVRYEKGSGEIRYRQVFDNIPQFKEAVVDYALKERANVKFTRWGSEKSEVRCSLGDGCPFRIYCSLHKSIGKFMVKTFTEHHTCISNGYSKVLKDGVIAKLLLDDIRKDPIKYKPKAIQEAIEDRFNLVVTNDQCRKAKAKALSVIQKEHDEQFARLKDYRLELISSNPESTVEVGIVRTDDGIEKFDRMYVCLAALREAWLGHCRPIFGIDGCFLKNNVKGQLLAAIGRDANNQFFPVAWGIVPVENTDSWIWFIKHLKDDLKLGDGEGFSLISDRQKGLLIAVEQELPKVEHRMCARHIYGNLRRAYPGKELPKDLFWAVAKSFNTADYERAIEALKNFDQGVYEAVMMKNPQNCSRAFFTCTSMCEDVSNNFSESYNNTINKAREMPLVAMMETIRRQCLIRNDMRRKKAEKHKGKYSFKVGKTITEEQKFLKYCQVIPCGNGHYEVTEHNQGFRVDMNAKTCACRRWSMTGIPCRHVLRVIGMKKHLKPEDFVNSDWYLTSKWVAQYNKPMMGVNGMYFWPKSGEPRIQPPPTEISKGPTKKQKRMKGKNESPKKKKKQGKEVEVEEPTKKKLTREGLTLHCGRCSHTGHNTRRCHNVGVATKPRVKKQNVAGSSQASQGSQASQIDCVGGSSSSSILINL